MKVKSMIYEQIRYKQRSRQLFHVVLPHSGVVLGLCILVLLLSSCTNPLATPSQSGPSTTNGSPDTATATPVVLPTATAGLIPITLQVVGCPSNLSINWDKLAGTHTNVNKVQKVICGSLEGAGTLEALVNVRYYSSDAKLDFSVYDNLSSTPSRTFGMQGLLNGSTSISSVGTLVTAEGSPKDDIPGTVDLYKEYQWNGTAFGQVLFPDMYPDVTRYQAEQTQALVNSEIASLQPGQPPSQIHDAWRLTAGGVVAHLVQGILHWLPTKYSVTLPLHAAQLSVLPITVTNLQPGGGGFVVTVHHLNDGPTNIFEVSQIIAINGNAALTSPTADARLSSPVQASGGSVASGTILGQIIVYDDVYNNVGNSGPIHASTSTGYVQFSNSVKYHLNAQGLEEGLVAFYATSQNNVALSNQLIMVKVWLSA